LLLHLAGSACLGEIRFLHYGRWSVFDMLWGNLDCVMKETSSIVLCAVFAAFGETAIKFKTEINVLK